MPLITATATTTTRGEQWEGAQIFPLVLVFNFIYKSQWHTFHFDLRSAALTVNEQLTKFWSNRRVRKVNRREEWGRRVRVGVGGGAIALRQFSLHCSSQYNFLVCCSLSPHFEHVRSDTKCKHDTHETTQRDCECVCVWVSEHIHSCCLLQRFASRQNGQRKTITNLSCGNLRVSR